MKGFYCPYCSSKYEIHIKKPDGRLICGHCGDNLLKVPLFNLKKFLALIATTALISPLIIMFYWTIEELQRDNQGLNKEKLAKIGIAIQSKQTMQG